MKVRAALILALVLVVFWTPLAVEAQPADFVRRIGFLAGTSRFPEIDGFQEGLREHGHVEGRNLLIEWRVAGGGGERIPWPSFVLAPPEGGGLFRLRAPAALA